MGEVNGLPRLVQGESFAYRDVLISEFGAAYIPGTKIIHGSGSRDLGNSGQTPVLRPGMVMGRNSTTKKWAPAYCTDATAAITSGALSIGVGTVGVAEILRRVGASGDLMVVGPSGTVAWGSLEHASAVHFTSLSGNLVVLSADGALRDFAVLSLIGVADGTYIPRAILPDGTGIKVTSGDITTNNIDTPVAKLLVGGMIDESQLITHQGHTTEFGGGNTQVKDYVKGTLRKYGLGYVFDGDF